MNKYCFLTILVVFLCGNIGFSQNDFKVGVNFGGNYPKQRGNDFAEFNNFKLGYLFGVSAEYSINSNWSIKTNLNYDRQILKREIISFNMNFEEVSRRQFTDNYSYLNIPLLVNYKLGNSSNFFINGGPFLNFLLDINYGKTGNDDITNNEDFYKKTDFGISLGLGVTFNNLSIEVRDDFGLRDLSNVTLGNNGTIKTNVLKLILNYSFDI